MIPGKTRENIRNNIYFKNIPLSLNESDLEAVFKKYGDIKSLKISKDEKGGSKGFGFISFVNPGSSHALIKESKEKGIFIPNTTTPIYLNYAMKKDDRLELLNKEEFWLNKLTLFVKLAVGAPIVILFYLG